MLTCWWGHDEDEHPFGWCRDLDGDGCRCIEFQIPLVTWSEDAGPG